jgi:hypothetical protein
LQYRSAADFPDIFICYHHIASFPASPIYYGFSGEYYIKSETFSKKLYHTSLEIALGAFAASLAALRRSSLYGAVGRKLNLTFLPCEQRSTRDGESHTPLPSLASNNRKANIFDTYSNAKSISCQSRTGGSLYL